VDKEEEEEGEEQVRIKNEKLRESKGYVMEGVFSLASIGNTLPCLSFNPKAS
jgi:hypothetical protein